MFLLYYIKSIAQSIIATTLMLSDTPHEKLFWQKYFSSNTEFKQYVTAMLTHPLPHDILRVILLHYLAVAGDTIETISDPYALFFAKQLSTLPTEKHDMFQYRWITLTTDGKYCITSHNKWHSSDAVRLWDIATKESIIIAKTHITPF